MKLGLVVPGGVDRSGVVRVVPRLLWLIERLAADHEVHVFALRQEPRPSSYNLLGATVHNVGRPASRVRAVAALLREHARGGFDVLHAFWAVPQGAVAVAVARLIGRPAVVHVVGGDIVDFSHIDYGVLSTWRGRRWLHATLRRAQLLTVQSLDMQQRARALGYETVRVPDGIELETWPPRQPRPALGSPVRLLQVADINRVKDQRTLLRALALVRKEYDIRLDHIGGDTLKGAVQREAAALGLGDAVRFHGSLPHQALRPFFERADALVISSLAESGPIVALEAAVAGLPVVGTHVGHLVEWSGRAALTAPPGDHEALARAITRLLRDDAQRFEFALRAQQLALRESAAAFAATVVGSSIELCAQGRPVSRTA